ncbi:MAG: glutathione peroxidase [Alphaproteobacteria bacterium]|nr:glutathione peroxidase [Alphaproteobacteria bacterium]
MSAHDFCFTSIDGKPLDLAGFAGHPVLVVNTASKCGLTPQYAGLQALWEKYKDQGLVVLGVPCNDFGGQEPGTETEVQEFCTTNYGVDFPMTSKSPVVGDARHPLYAWAEGEAGEDAVPQWNFHKLLIGKDGTLMATFPSAVTPDDGGLVAAVEGALAG